MGSHLHWKLNKPSTLDVFNKLELDKKGLTRVSYLLVGLGDKTIAVQGTINLSLILGDKKYKRKAYAEFVVVDTPLAYNVILSKLVLNYHRIVINMDFLCLKLPAPSGIIVIQSSQKSAQE